MTPETAYSCDDKTRLLAELQEVSATIALLHHRELEIVATSTNMVKLTAIEAEIQEARERWGALLSALEKHVAAHGC